MLFEGNWFLTIYAMILCYPVIVLVICGIMILFERR